MFNHHTRPVLLSLALFIALAVAHTWPMAAAPSNWSRIDGDGGLNTWAVSWVAHALLTDPASLFEANIFHPEHLTLAYSEAMILQGAIAVPVIAFGGSAVLAYSVSVLAGFALTGWAFCLLVRRWTGSWAAGYVAGSLAAFNAYTLLNLTHLQFLHAGFLALALFALDRLIASPRFRDSAWLAVAFALQALTSVYLMVFTVFALTFALLARTGEWIKRAVPLAIQLGAAALLAGILLWPYLAPYRSLQQTQRLERSADDAMAASWRNYLSTGANLHYEPWSKSFGGGSSASFFPGIVAVVLVAAAMSDRLNRRDPRLRMCAAVGAGCALLSFAPLMPFYRNLYDAVPLLRAVRAIYASGQLVLLMIAVLAGFGVAALRRRAGSSSAWPIAAVVMVFAVNAEAFRAPVGYVWFDGVPKAYDVLAEERVAVVAELPFPMPSQWFLNSPYLVNSTRHWHPMLNGYSGFRPASYEASYNATRGFPSDESVIALHQLGVTHVVIHRRDYPLPNRDQADPYSDVSSIRLIASDEEVLIYKLQAR